jgi:hypothetical protein
MGLQGMKLNKSREASPLKLGQRSIYGISGDGIMTKRCEQLKEVLRKQLFDSSQGNRSGHWELR